MAQVRGKAHIHLILTKRYRCSNYAVSGAVAGFGDTPKQAYDDWCKRWSDWQQYKNKIDSAGRV